MCMFMYMCVHFQNHLLPACSVLRVCCAASCLRALQHVASSSFPSYLLLSVSLSLPSCRCLSSVPLLCSMPKQNYVPCEGQTLTIWFIGLFLGTRSSSSPSSLLLSLLLSMSLSLPSCRCLSSVLLLCSMPTQNYVPCEGATLTFFFIGPVVCLRFCYSQTLLSMISGGSYFLKNFKSLWV